LHRNFGNATDEFLKNLDYSEKHAVGYQLGYRWLSLPLLDKTGVASQSIA
jgi:hypothetical protein